MNAFSIPHHWAFLVSALVLLLSTLFIFWKTLEKLEVSLEIRQLLVALSLLNPFCFRFYLALPWSLTDLGFELALGLLTYALLFKKPALWVGSVILATLSRQTMLAVFPVAALGVWILWSSAAIPRSRKIGTLVLGAFGMAATYKVTGMAIAGVATPNNNIASLTEGYDWIKYYWNTERFVGFMMRGIAPLFFTFVLWMREPGFTKINRTQAILILLSLSIMVQPFLGGPLYTSNNISRLNMLGQFPIAVALAMRLKTSKWNIASLLPWALLCTGMGSFHHVYSYLSTHTNDQAAYFFVTYLLGWMIFTAKAFSCR